MKLNQIIALANGEKSRKQSAFSKIYQTLKVDALFAGISKRYVPFEEDPSGASNLPPDDKAIQTTVAAMIDESKEVLESMFNIIATQDIANCDAKANVVVDDKIILPKVPVTHLLFLEKQLIDLHTFVAAIPTLDPAESWTYDKATGYHRSEPKKTVRTKKVPKNHVKTEATDKHPAQVDVYTEDVPQGTWTTTYLSGAMSLPRKKELLEKIRNLDQAIKLAREEANSIDVQKSDLGSKLLTYIFE